jgi:nucleosome binding factor SPN SPT16 subunit
MIINLSVGFLNIKNRETNVTYSIWLSDTIEIQSNNEDPKILTADLDKRLKMVNYELSDDIPKGNEPKVKKESSEKKKVMEKKIESDKKLNIATEKKVKETERDTSDEEKMDTPEVRKTSVILRERLRSRGKSSNFEEVERQLSIQRVRVF